MLKNEHTHTHRKWSFTLQEHQVKQVLKAVNIRKVAGLDGVLGKIVCACTDQLRGVLTRMLNLSLSQATIPPMSEDNFIPVSKSSAPKCLIDNRPIALISAVIKCFERLILQHMEACFPQNLDFYCFAYSANRSAEDAIATSLHRTLEPRNCIRMLFIDYSSAFKIIIPGILVDKLINISLPLSTCAWIRDSLSKSPLVGVTPLAYCRLLHHDPQHRLPPRQCAEPSPVHPPTH